jgi:imidazoleglycerol phosphate dehydratase HisB
MTQLIVDRLSLRMPGSNSDDAKRLSELVAEGLAVHLLTSSGEVEQIEVRVPWLDGTTDEHLADAICKAIIQAIQHAT